MQCKQIYKSEMLNKSNAVLITFVTMLCYLLFSLACTMCMDAIRWETLGMWTPPLFSHCGNIICHVPSHFYL